MEGSKGDQLTSVVTFLISVFLLSFCWFVTAHPANETTSQASDCPFFGKVFFMLLHIVHDHLQFCFKVIFRSIVFVVCFSLVYGYLQSYFFGLVNKSCSFRTLKWRFNTAVRTHTGRSTQVFSLSLGVFPPFPDAKCFYR